MCPFCIGAVAWAAAGAVSAGGLGVLAAVVQHQRRPASAGDTTAHRDDEESPGRPGSD